MKKLSAALDSLRAMARHTRGGRKSRAHRQMHFLIHTRDPRLEQLQVRALLGVTASVDAPSVPAIPLAVDVGGQKAGQNIVRSMDKVVIADATMAAPISQATTLPTSGETVVYSKMNDYTVYTSATSGVVGYEDYDSTNNANINLTSMRFAGGTTVAGGILWFDFYSDRSMTNLVNYTGVQTPQSGDFVYTVTLGSAITIPDAGVLEISANTGTTGHWYGGSVAPSIGTNDSSYGGIHPNNYDFELRNTAQSGQANLTPYQPSGWSDKIVVSNRTGTNTDDTLDTTDTLYVDWAVTNNGTATASSFYSSLYLDNSLLANWQTASLSPGSYAYVQDFTIGTLKAGSHTLSIVADSTGAIAGVERNGQHVHQEFYGSAGQHQSGDSRSSRYHP